jgi:hypothetical protein
MKRIILALLFFLSGLAVFGLHFYCTLRIRRAESAVFIHPADSDQSDPSF